ncbi:uncharacterized protein DNG_03627 [Cephalotrichum gorgonifer]|uniref:Uncharacterized protein n=1 Tax=Cephalotrichum gorgonifer TaxID=2041049 RepID=A0AAE8MUK7_9PEZI|nr:uncharacterized protein DNG_03627 [Cephalotrichum gorgonifer]
MASQRLHYCCILEPRCRLCQFQLQDGESVVVARGVRPSPIVAFHKGRVCTPESSEEVENGESRVVYHMCFRGICPVRNSAASCIHESCYFSRPTPLSPSFIPATHYDFTPPPSYDTRRRRRIQRILARRLGLGLMSHMPEELCLMVAEHLLRECAVVTCQELTSYSHGPESSVDLSLDVYVTYVKFEGIPYLQTLSNTPPSADGGKAGLVFEPGDGQVVRKIYIGYDHLGVRSIQFATSDDELPPSPPLTDGVWWGELAGEHGIRHLSAKTDGLKIRRLVDSADANTSSSRDDLGNAWAFPSLDRQLICLEKGGIAPDALSGLRMSFFDCNKPGTDGYCAATHGFHLSRIVAHRPGGDIGFYGDLDDISRSMLWMYFPMNPGEAIVGIWTVQLWSRFVALLLRTNQQRAVLFGSYFLDHGPGFQLNHICSMNKEPSRIYFNDWDPVRGNLWIDYLGIDTKTTKPGASITSPARTSPAAYPPCLVPAFPPPYSEYNELWHYTNCRMEDVVEVTLCVDPTDQVKPIIGILVHYRNGCRACLGQYRLDWTEPPIFVDPSRALRIGMGRSPEKLPYVAEVGQGDADPDLEGAQWMEVPWQGRLEWWFSHRQSRLDYSDGNEKVRQGAASGGR